jgi:hypothetical protein
MRLSSQSEAFDRAAGFQPDSSALDEFLGRMISRLEKSRLKGRLQARLPAPLN